MKHFSTRLLVLIGAGLLLAACAQNEDATRNNTATTSGPPEDLVGAPVVADSGADADNQASAATDEASGGSQITAAPTLPLPADLALVQTEPVLAHGRGGSWDALAMGPGAILFADGLFHMLYNANDDLSQPGGIGYAVSADGRVWERVSDEPVLTAADLPAPAYNMRASALLRQDDGTWMLFAIAIDSPRTIPEIDIWRATAAGPSGPWTFDPEPALRHGPRGSWDAFSVSSPDIVYHDGQFIMYYSGFDALTAHIGRATSRDGITWTKYDDPATDEDRFRESDPVFLAGSGGQTWNSIVVRNPEVWRLPEGGWGMYFNGREAVLNTPAKAGLATSPDGINWTPLADNPVFRPEELENGWGMASTELVIHEAQLWLYYNTNLRGVDNYWDIYLLAGVALAS